MPATVSIRKATFKDVGQMARLAIRLIKSHQSYDSLVYEMDFEARECYEAYFKRSLRKKKFILLVAESEGKLVGYCLAAIENRPKIYLLKRRCFVHDLFLSEKYRKIGLGKKFLDIVSKFAFERNVKLLQLNVDCRNVEGIKFYKRQGFTEYEKVLSKKLF